MEQITILLEAAKSTFSTHIPAIQHRIAVLDRLFNESYFKEQLLPFIKKGFFIALSDTSDLSISDLQIIDNMHDLFGDRGKELKEERNELIRKKLINLLSHPEIVQKFEDNPYLDVEGDVYKEMIAGLYGVNFLYTSKANGTKQLPTLLHPIKEERYYETYGIFEKDAYICPYKKAIDPFKRNCDSLDARRLVVGEISMTDYSKTKVTFNLDGKEVGLKLNNPHNIKYYKPFFSSPDISFNPLKLVKLDSGEYIKLANSVREIVDIFNNLKVDKDFYNYVYAGLLLKFAGDNGQGQIFSQFEQFKYFNTKDFYCYLYTLLTTKPDKFVLFEKTGGGMTLDIKGKLFLCQIVVKETNFLDEITYVINSYPIRKKMNLTQTDIKTKYIVPTQLPTMITSTSHDSIPLTRFPINFLNDIQYATLVRDREELIEKYGKEEYELKIRVCELHNLYDNTVITKKDPRDVFVFVDKVLELHDANYEPLRHLPVFSGYPQTLEIINLMRNFQSLTKKYPYLAGDDEISLKVEQKSLGIVIGFAIRSMWIFQGKDIDFTKPIKILIRELEDLINKSLKEAEKEVSGDEYDSS